MPPPSTVMASKDAVDDSEPPESVPVPRFEPEEEAELLSEYKTQKAGGSKLFASARYSEAIGEYDKALATCPNYLFYEVAILHSNIAICHLKLEDWKAAVDAATASLQSLNRLQPSKKPNEGKSETGDNEIVELDGDDEKAEEQLAQLKLSDERIEAIQKIKSKALMRRAKGKMEQGGWGNLAGAEEDYKELSKMASLSGQDRKVVQKALASLPPQISSAKDKEMGEMMGKLKELGNGILKPFGLSTDMFKLQKDEGSGGYSMSFDQGKGS